MVQIHIAREIAIKNGGSNIEFLLLKRSALQEVYPSVWQVITGKQKESETFIQCALREIYEETGLVPTEMWALPFVATFFLPQTDSIHHSPVFGALVPFKNEIQLSDEHEEFAWVLRDEAFNKLVMPSHREGTDVFLKEILLKEERGLFKIPF